MAGDSGRRVSAWFLIEYLYWALVVPTVAVLYVHRYFPGGDQ